MRTLECNAEIVWKKKKNLFPRIEPNLWIFHSSGIYATFRFCFVHIPILNYFAFHILQLNSFITFPFSPVFSFYLTLRLPSSISFPSDSSARSSISIRLSVFSFLSLSLSIAFLSFSTLCNDDFSLYDVTSRFGSIRVENAAKLISCMN